MPRVSIKKSRFIDLFIAAINIPYCDSIKNQTVANIFSKLAKPLESKEKPIGQYPFIPTSATTLFYLEVAIKAYKDIAKKDIKVCDIGGGISPLLYILSSHITNPKNLVSLEYNINLCDFVNSNELGFKAIQGDLLTYTDYSDYDILYSYNPLSNSGLMEKGILQIIDNMKKDQIFIFNNAGVYGSFMTDNGFKYLGTYGLFYYIK